MAAAVIIDAPEGRSILDLLTYQLQDVSHSRY